MTDFGYYKHVGIREFLIKIGRKKELSQADENTLEVKYRDVFEAAQTLAWNESEELEKLLQGIRDCLKKDGFLEVDTTEEKNRVCLCRSCDHGYFRDLIHSDRGHFTISRCLKAHDSRDIHNEITTLCSHYSNEDLLDD